MFDIVVLSERQATPTSLLSRRLGQAFATAQGFPPPTVAGWAGGRGARSVVVEADILIVGTSAHLGHVPAALRRFFGRFPANALAGTYAIPVVTGNLPSRMSRAEAALRQMLAGLGAEVAAFGLTAQPRDLADVGTTADRFVAALLTIHDQRL